MNDQTKYQIKNEISLIEYENTGSDKCENTDQNMTYLFHFEKKNGLLNPVKLFTCHRISQREL